MNEKPTYKHDCKTCVFLGNVIAGKEIADLYFCQQSGVPTVRARYSNHGPDYTSGLPPGNTAELIVAEQRAIARGYLPNKT